MVGRVGLLGLGFACLIGLDAAWAQEAARKTEQNPEWCSSKWGADDEIGAANLLTPDLARQAAGLVTTGKTYALGIETNSSTPAFGPRGFRVQIYVPGQAGGGTVAPNGGTFNDDLVIGNMGIGSQLDGLGHFGVRHVYYNCNRASDFVQPDGVTKLGIENVPPIVTRGVLLDMADHFGVDVVPGGTVFNRAEIEAQAAKQGIDIRRGDVVLFHTGWLSAHGDDGPTYMAGEPGIGQDGARYLIGKEVVAVGADNWGLEVFPGTGEAGDMSVHQLLLAANGIYILEAMNTADLAADGVSEFMFVLGAPRYTGTVQAIVNPIAIR